VVVTGVLNRTGVPAGDCSGGSDFTFRPLVGTVLPNTTTLVLDQSLYSDGPGCCLGTGCAGSCRFQEAFEVITSVGNVPAGHFNYRVFFQNCRSCATVSAATSQDRTRTGRPPSATAVP
jgi:hypothetical protein